MITDDVQQGSDEWKALHYGRATASQFSRIITPGAGAGFFCVRPDGETCGTTHNSESTAEKCAKRKKMGECSTMKAPVQLAAAANYYAAQLAAERLTGGPEDVQEFWSSHIQRGIDHEPRVRAAFRLETGLDVRTVGFIRLSDEPYAPGCSPDGLILDPLSGAILGGLEVKCPNLAQFTLWKEEGILPPEHKCQIHGCLAVTGLPYWMFMSFHANVPDKPFLLRVEPDEFTQAIKDVLPRFEAEVQKKLALLSGN